jgi:hypothetical protein
MAALRRCHFVRIRFGRMAESLDSRLIFALPAIQQLIVKLTDWWETVSVPRELVWSLKIAHLRHGDVRRAAGSCLILASRLLINHLQK